MSNHRASSFAWWAAAMILVSAFLLFQVQPIISKIILPWFGGSPAVWSTCMVFFQLVLLAGYGYAHFLTQMFSPRRQVIVHCTLLVLALLTLPISPGPELKPVDGAYPILRILSVLGLSVGLPYFLLSSTGPLVQAWFGWIQEGKSPYRLYALSNIGSLAALLGYPFLFEPRMTLPQQDVFWSIGFGLFALLGGVLATFLWKHKSDATATTAAEQLPEADTNSGWDRKIAWVVLPALASTALLAVTNHLSQDVAAVPFLWVIPLSLYLLSFIICFDGDHWYRRGFFVPAAMFSVLWLCAVSSWEKVDEVFVRYGLRPFSTLVETSIESMLKSSGKLIPALDNLSFTFKQFEYNPWFQGIFYLTFLFLGCMVCHGELAALKPAKKRLTEYYMLISAGGALGGIFVALACPFIFTWYVELPLSLAAIFIVSGISACMTVSPRLESSSPLRFLLLAIALAAVGTLSGDAAIRSSESMFLKTMVPCLLAVAGALLAYFIVATSSRELQTFCSGLAGLLFLSAVCGVVLNGLKSPYDDRYIAQVRSFYGALQVKTDAYRKGNWLCHGRIQHGFQHEKDDPRRRIPTTYYALGSGVGLALQEHPNAGNLKVGVVGLGTGTIAAYGKKGETYRFYEIDQVMLDLSDTYFGFRKESDAKTEVTLGDARLTMEREEPQGYDVIAVDAFSGDAIPIHLLTRESMDIYRKHLKPDGILAVHISNRYLELNPVVKGMARHAGWESHVVEYEESDDDEGLEDSSSVWVLVTDNKEFLAKPHVQTKFGYTGDDERVIEWTDQYSNLFEIFTK